MRPRVAAMPAPKKPAPPLIEDTGNAKVDAVADVVNSVASPFQNPPDPERGVLGKVEHGIGAVMGVVGAPFQLLDTGFAMITAPLASMMPGFPAATLLMPHLGTPHAHAHPPSLTPPNPVPVPLPSIGQVMLAGCVSVLIGGVPAARAGDVGLAPLCFSFGPAFDIWTGSSNTWIGGSRAARMMDITRHCNPASAMNAIGKAMGAIGVVAGAVSAGASAAAGAALQAAMQAAQAAADAAALAMSALLGKDPGIPPAMGAVMMGNPMVLIGGFPMPDTLELLGGMLKGLKMLGKAVGKSKAFGKLLSKVGLCNSPGEPVHPFTGEVYNDFEDYHAPDSAFVWERHYRSGWNEQDGPLGFGFRHFYQRKLTLLRKRALYETHDGELVALERREDGTFATTDGFSLRALDAARYELRTDRDETLEFELLASTPPSCRLTRYKTRRIDLYLFYDASNRLRALSELSLGQTIDTLLVYDANGRIEQVQRGVRGQASLTVSRYSYYDGCLVEWHDALGGVARFRYDSRHRMLRGTDRRGYSFHWHYDPKSGRCIKSHGDDGLWAIEALYEGSQSIFTEADGGKWIFKHYPDGTISHIVDPYGGVKQYVRDDASGRIVKQIAPGGVEIAWIYDDDGKHIHRRDQWGNLLWPEDVDPDPPNPLRHDGPLTQRGWLLGRPIANIATRMNGVPASIASAIDELTRHRKADETLIRDSLGRVTEVRYADGSSRRMQHDANGNVIAAQQTNGGWLQRAIMSWDLTQAERSALGFVTHFGYTHHAERASIVDANGNRTDYLRDHCHRVRQVVHDGKVHLTYTYDEHGGIASEQDGDGAVLVRYTSNRQGLHASAKLVSGESYTYEYDSNGNCSNASSSRHEVRRSFYRNRQIKADLRDGLGTVHHYADTLTIRQTDYLGRFIVRYSRYDRRGQRIVTPDGKEHCFYRTEAGVFVRETANGTCEASVFDAHERLVVSACWKRDTPAQGVLRAARYEYNAASELVAWTDSERGPMQFGYDADHRLVVQRDQRGELAYAYDAAGNLARTPNYTKVERSPGNFLAYTDSERFEYDARRRLSRRIRWDGLITTYTYDSADQLVEVSWSDREEVWRAAYDGLGRRLWREYAGKRLDFFWDKDRLAIERDSDGKVRLYIYANQDSLVPFMWLDYDSADAAPESGKAFYLFSAPTGMPLRVEDANGTCVWQVKSLDAYGDIEVEPAASVSVRLRFAGHYYDEHLELCYNRFRDYDTKLCRYLQPDPLGHAGGTNLYSYPANPVVDVDLRGLVHKKTAKTDGDAGDGDAKPSAKPEAKKKPIGDGPEQTQALKDKVRAEVEAKHATLSQKGRKEEIMVAGVRNKRTGDIFTATNADAAKVNKADMHPVTRKRVEAQDQVVKTNERLLKEGKTTDDIHKMSDAELRAELAKDGVDPHVEGMDTTDQLRRTNDRVKMREDQLGRPMNEDDWGGFKRESGNHGEVKAMDDALKKIEADEGRPATADDLKDLELHNQRIPPSKSKPISDDAMPRCDHCRGITDGVEPSPDLQAAEQAMDQSAANRWLP